VVDAVAAVKTSSPDPPETVAASAVLAVRAPVIAEPSIDSAVELDDVISTSPVRVSVVAVPKVAVNVFAPVVDVDEYDTASKPSVLAPLFVVLFPKIVVAPPPTTVILSVVVLAAASDTKSKRFAVALIVTTASLAFTNRSSPAFVTAVTTMLSTVTESRSVIPPLVADTVTVDVPVDESVIVAPVSCAPVPVTPTF